MRSGITRREALAGGATLALTASLSIDAYAQSFEAVVAEARKEGKLTLYHNLRPAGVEVILKTFRGAVPQIQTEQIRLGSGPLNERFSTEFAAGRHLADVLISYADDELLRTVDERFAPWQPPEFTGNFAPELQIQGRLHIIQQAREVIIWNKSLVKEAEAPREWADLFDPRWKGKVALNTPWRSISIQQIFAYWEDIGIKDAAERMKANEVRFFEGSSGVIQAVVRGDVAVAQITDIPLNGMLDDGAPLGFVYPKSGTTTSDAFAAVSAHAPHPNVARVFVNWLMSKAGQAELVEQGGLSVTRKGAPALSQLPATSALSNVVSGAKVLNAERQKQLIGHWRTVFGVK